MAKIAHGPKLASSLVQSKSNETLPPRAPPGERSLVPALSAESQFLPTPLGDAHCPIYFTNPATKPSRAPVSSALLRAPRSTDLVDQTCTVRLLYVCSVRCICLYEIPQPSLPRPAFLSLSLSRSSSFSPPARLAA